MTSPFSCTSLSGYTGYSGNICVLLLTLLLFVILVHEVYPNNVGNKTKERGKGVAFNPVFAL
jgi:hypothetical protein